MHPLISEKYETAPFFAAHAQYSRQRKCLGEGGGWQGEGVLLLLVNTSCARISQNHTFVFINCIHSIF